MKNRFVAIEPFISFVPINCSFVIQAPFKFYQYKRVTWSKFHKSYCCYLQICAIACSHANRQGNRFRWMENCQTDRFYQPHTTVVSWTLFLNTNTMFSAVCFLLVIVLLFFPFYCSFPSLSIDFYQLISS